MALPLASNEGAAHSALPEHALQGEPARCRILIVDDEPLLGQTLMYAFKGRHDVVVCTNGRDAVALLERDGQFDLVLCDLAMPEVSGRVVYEQVVRQKPGLLPRFVLMTGGAFTEPNRDFVAHYAGRQLEKPFTVSDVERTLSQVQASASKP